MHYYYDSHFHALGKCDVKRVPHPFTSYGKAWCKKSTTWEMGCRKRWNMKWVQHEKVQCEKCSVWGKAVKERAQWKEQNKIQVKNEGLNWKKCNTKKMQHGKSATWEDMQKKKGTIWKECNTKKVQHKNNQTQKKSARQKRYNTGGKSAIQKETNPKSAQHGQRTTRKKCSTKKCNMKWIQH